MNVPPIHVSDLAEPCFGYAKIHGGRHKLLERGRAACLPAMQLNLKVHLLHQIVISGSNLHLPCHPVLHGELGVQSPCTAPVQTACDSCCMKLGSGIRSYIDLFGLHFREPPV